MASKPTRTSPSEQPPSVALTAAALRMAHRLRMRLEARGKLFDLLAALLGVTPRTLTRLATWSGPTAVAMLLLGDLPAHQVLDRVATILRQRGIDELPFRDVLTALRDELSHASADETLADVIEKQLKWVYWATSARAKDDKTLRLANEDHIICRPLLEDTGEIHTYLFALRTGDRVLLAYNGKAEAWFELTDGDEHPEGLGSSEHAALASDESTYLIHHLPRVFRFVKTTEDLGKELAAGPKPYRCFDGKLAGQKPSYFTGLAVQALPGEAAAPRTLERAPGQRSRMTSYRGYARKGPA